MASIEDQLPPEIDRQLWRRRQSFIKDLHKVWDIFNLDWWVHTQNTRELDAIAEFMNGEMGQKAWSDMQLSVTVEIEATRRLTNFAASGRALVEHAIKQKRAVNQLPVEPKVGKALDEVQTHIGFHLLRELRDSTLHAAHKPSILRLDFSESQGVSRTIWFDLSGLGESRSSRSRRTEAEAELRAFLRARRGQLSIADIRNLAMEALGTFEVQHRGELGIVSQALNYLPIRSCDTDQTRG